MASCLYECLCEAELEKYYPHFAAFGLQKIDELARVSMKDYTKLGVHDMNDRKRLFQLIRIIKIMQEEDIADLSKQEFQPNGLFSKPQVPRSGPCRQLRFESFFEDNDGTVKDSESYGSSDLSANERKNSVGEILGQPHDSELSRLTKRDLNTPGICTKKDLNCPTVSDDIAPLLGDSEAPIVQRITHISGYNYGLPHSCIRSNTSEKETPWTESEKIRVCVRKRPLGLREERRGEVNIITVKDKETLLLHEKKEAVDLTQYILQHVFYFDEVFGESCTNQDVYMKTAHPLIQHVFNGLFAREDSKHVVQIVGLREVQVDSVDLLLEVILKGGKERSTGATGVNSDSSRSHAIIQIQIKDTSNRTFGRISFIDLAGSERAADARDSDRQTKMEGAEINQSLLALKECIRALDQEHAHTPFRQSKLTQVLKDSFIGNSKTCMIANVSPSHMATEHTLNTLRYADRVKELKKGIKCSTPVTNRRWTAGNVSPKRVQNSSSLPSGEKSSPKKVKLGLQHPPNATKAKACPAAPQPHSVPFTSTPRGVNKGHAYKGNPSSQWFHHTSPVKGVLRLAHPQKKKPDDLSPHSEKHPTAKDFMIKNAATAETTASAQRDKYIHDKRPAQCLKVQTVQPVQKQLVSRDDFPFGDGNLPSDDRQEWGNTFAKPCVETWTNLPAFQKEREEHLRLYHQQFQQPPLLQQKLNYQPLERFLTQYKPQEIQVKQELSVTPTEAQSKEGMQLEDLDDSDFSEDSFSPVCSQQSMKRRSTNKCSQHSFFLHQREQGTEDEQKGQKRQDLLFKYAIPMQEHELDDSWDSSEGSPKESIKNAGYSKPPSDWSYDLAVEPPPSNTAEKPYCLQEDPPCQWKNDKDFLVDHKQYKSKQRCLVYSSDTTLTPEKDAPCVSSMLKSGTPECKEIIVQHEEKEEPTLDRQAALGGEVKRRAQKNGVNHCVSSSFSPEFTSELAAPLRVSLLGYEKTADTVSSSPEKPPSVKQMPSDRSTYSPQRRFEEEGWQCTRSRALTDSMLELGEQMRRAGRHCTLRHPPQTGDKWLSPACCDVKPCCCLLGSGSLKQGVIPSLFVGCDPTETSTAESVGCRGKKEGGLFLYTSTCKEYVGGKQCDAEVKDNTGNSGKSNSSQEINADTPEKSYFSAAPCFLSVGSMEYAVQSQESSLLLQPKSGLRSENFGHSEDQPKSSLSNEEIGLLKNKLMQSIFTQETFAADSGSATKENVALANAKSPSGTSNSSSPSATSEMGKRQREALEKAQQAVIRAHRQQLDEMASLCFKEECLISRMSATDFQNFVTKLDEVLVLKSKCIQTMRAQLQLCLASPGTDLSLQTPPPV
ncbi:kinesin-like protein KIF24 isoform 2-T4 [Porphyrio hochstetteri]